jgi:site-specific recombinase XerD
VKDKLIRDIEIKLSETCPGIDRDQVMICIISCLDEYDVSEKSTQLAERSQDVNDRILKRYSACLMLDGKSKKTIFQYIRTCQKLGQDSGKYFTEITTNDIRLFLGQLKVRGAKNSTIENQRSYISAFFRWMLAEDIISKNPCEKIKPIKCENVRRLPFSDVQIDKLRLACRSEKTRAMIEVLLSSGVRCEELINLDINDIDIRRRSVRVRNGKGGKDRVTYISEVAAEHLDHYLNSRNDNGPELFRSQQGGRYSDETSILRIMKSLSKRAGVDNVHPHRFRRTFATQLYRRGMDLHEIQRLMGHSNVQTTLGYIYTDDAQLRAAYQKYAA